MEKFKEIKDEILRRGYKANACSDIKRAEDSESMEELAQVIKDNFDWCVYKRVLDTEIIGKYKKEFASVDIYANESRSNGYVVIDREVNSIFGSTIAILYGDATVKYVSGNAYISVYSYIECKISNHAIMRVRSENKIYTNTEVERPNNN